MISYNSFVFKVIFPSYVGLCTLVYHRPLLSSRLLRKNLVNWREFLGKWFTPTHPLEKELPYVNVFKRKRCRTIIFLKIFLTFPIKHCFEKYYEKDTIRSQCSEKRYDGIMLPPVNASSLVLIRCGMLCRL